MLSPKTARLLHRRLGLLFSLFVFLAAGSGVLHTIMGMTQSAPPPPPPNRLGEVAPAVKLRPDEATAKLGPVTKLAALSLVELDGRPLYRLALAGDKTPRYVFADTGEVSGDADERLAARIASAHLAGKPVRKAAYLTQYDNEYIAIFRILPVYRFEADDAKHTRLYVSTATGSVTRATDDGKQFEANTFGLLHKYMFIHDKGWRDAAMIAVMSGITLAGLSGLVLFGVTRPKRKTA